MLQWKRTKHNGPTIASKVFRRLNHTCKFCIHWRFQDAMVLNDGHSESLRSVSLCDVHGYETCEDMHCGLFDFRLRKYQRSDFNGEKRNKRIRHHRMPDGKSVEC